MVETRRIFECMGEAWLSQSKRKKGRLMEPAHYWPRFRGGIANDPAAVAVGSR